LFGHSIDCVLEEEEEEEEEAQMDEGVILKK
jgi:hypothetical protein